MKNILEEIDYWKEKDGKEGLYNTWAMRNTLKETLIGFKEREEGIENPTLPEEEYQSKLKRCNLSREELLKLLESGDY